MVNEKSSEYPAIESLNKLGNIPIFDSTIKTASTFYTNFKESNSLLNWSFGTVEEILYTAVNSTRPIFNVLEKPIQTIDKLMCKSIDIMENMVPSVTLRPDQMLENVIFSLNKHISNAKLIGISVLDNKLTMYAVNQIDDVLVVADTYVDKYLPDEIVDPIDDVDLEFEEKNETDGPTTFETFNKGKQLSLKLKRRLTQRTLDEVKGLKKQCQEAISVLIKATELISTSPMKALTEIRNLWNNLIGNKENNAETSNHSLEHILSLITRESANRLLHLVNFLRMKAINTPRTVVSVSSDLFQQFLNATNSLVKVAHLKEVKSRAAEETLTIIDGIKNLYEDLQNYTADALEQLAIYLSKRLEAEKITVTYPRRRFQSRAQNHLNGVY